jgi:hypothetical protein
MLLPDLHPSGTNNFYSAPKQFLLPSLLIFWTGNLINNFLGGIASCFPALRLIKISALLDYLFRLLLQTSGKFHLLPLAVRQKVFYL